MSPIGFDSAFNFQVAQSLLEKFSYQSKYVPIKIYHNQITTNGPIQYYMTFFIGLFGLDLGRSIGLGIIGGLAAVSVYKFSRHSFILYCLLLLFWPLFAKIHTFFLGELLAIAIVMVGLKQWEGWQDWSYSQYKHRPFFANKIWAHPTLWTTSLAFGTAIATKLIAVAVIPLLLYCLFFHAMRDYPIKRKAEKLTLFAYWVILPVLVALVFFILQFSISILHSGGDPGSIISSLKLFISEHLHQAHKAKAGYEFKAIFCENGITIVIVLTALLSVLLYKNTVFALPAVCIMILLFISQLNLRRMLPFIVPFMLLSIKIIVTRQSKTEPSLNLNSLIILFFSGLTLLAGSLLTHTPPYLLDTLRQFSLTGAPHNFALITKQQSTYKETLIAIIINLDGPVFTTNWWQFPEISLRTGKVFYDRRAPDNSQMLLKKPCYLLFSSQNTGDLSSENSLCGAILFKDGDLILCEYRPRGL